MSAINPPLVLQNAGHASNLLRQLWQDTYTPGVMAADHLEVTEQSTPALGVTVAAGRAVVAGDESSSQGVYYVSNDDDEDVALATADATNDRIDLIVARVKDSFYSGGDDEWEPVAVTGTPAASPSAPAAPANSYVLAEVLVPSDPGGNPAITNGDITDMREGTRFVAGLVAAEGFVGEAVASGATFVLEVALDRVYRSLRVEIEAAHTNTGWDVGRFFINQDTGANYHGYTYRERRSGTHPGDPLATAVTNSIPIFLRDDGVLAATLFIWNPAGGSNPTLHGSGFVSWGTTDTTGFRVECQGQRKNTAAVTHVRLTAPSGFNLASGSKISVYGVPD